MTVRRTRPSIAGRAREHIAGEALHLGLVNFSKLAIPALALALTSAHVSARDQVLLDQAKQSTGAFLTSVQKLVNIDSGTGFEKGLTEVEDIIIGELKALGAKVETYPAKPSVGRNILATLEGTGKGQVVLLAHTDTVHEEGAAKERPFRIDGNRAYGPGVMDDKGGIVLALQTAKLLQTLGFKDYGRITFLFNPDEERGSFGSRDLIRKVAKEHHYALVLEFGSPEDKVTNWRKGIGYFKLEVKGKAAHAGAEPDKGCNALVEAAPHQVLQLSKLGDPEKQTTLNFTILQVGNNPNVIPDVARAQADLRVLYPEEYERVESDSKRLTENRLLRCSEVKPILERGRPPSRLTQRLIPW